MAQSLFDGSASKLRLIRHNQRTQLLAGLFFALMGSIFGAVCLLAEDHTAAATIISTLLFLTALCTVFWRRGLVIDRWQQVFVRWWGIGFPLRERREELGSRYDYVSVTCEVRGRKPPHIVIPVRLCGAGEEPIELLAPTVYEDARRNAERLANYYAIGMRDSTTGTEVIREPGTLDEPLRDRLLREGFDESSLPAPPRLVVETHGAGTEVVLPAKGFQRCHWKTLRPTVVFGVLVLLAALISKPGHCGAAVMLAILLLVNVAVVLKSALSRDRIRFSRAGIERRSWGLPKSSYISTDELEELVIAPPVTSSDFLRGNLVAQSDELSLVLASGLSKDELEWLHRSICLAIVPPKQVLSDT